MTIRCLFSMLVATLLGASAAARAQEADEVPRTSRTWDAAIGAVASFGAEYPGGRRYGAGWKPGAYVRWGRVSLATRSAFVTRTSDATPSGGLRLELGGGRRWRASVGLRSASGRDESASDDLRGLGDVRDTVRLRVSASYRFGSGWRLGGGWSSDLLGRGHGWLADASISREQVVSPVTRWSWGAGINIAGNRYQQTFFGITAEQSARSGYEVYEPRAGLRDSGVFVSARHDLSRHWFVFGGAGASWLLGPSADSPLVRRAAGWSVNSGLAYRF